MIDILVGIIIFFIGILFGSIFNMIGNILSNSHDKNYKYTNCLKCNNELKFTDISIISYIKNKGKCKKCKEKVSIFPMFIEIITGLLFIICFFKYRSTYPEFLYIIYSISFISSLIIIIVSDIKYMIIPDQVLIFFGILLAVLKLLIGYFNEEYKTILDVGYSIVFLLYDGFFMFLIMYIIKSIGDFICKKDSMGGGDVKMMFYISLVMGWKISIVIIFLAAFLALPVSIIGMLKDNNHQLMLPFGPYIAISTMIIFLCKIDINMVLEYII